MCDLESCQYKLLKLALDFSEFLKSESEKLNIDENEIQIMLHDLLK